MRPWVHSLRDERTDDCASICMWYMVVGAMAQMDLFGGGEEPDAAATGASGSVPAAEVSDEVRAIAARMPAGVRLGTSSWSFPGWQGIVYRDAHSEQVLARRGLGAYAAHPLLATVGVDRTFYAPVAASALAAYAAVVPAHFRFMVKAHEALTLPRYPQHPRYGAQRGQANPLLFDLAWARDQVVGPYVEGLGDKAGVLLFQFAPMPAHLFAGDTKDAGGKSAPRRFAERLYRFLRDLPRGPRYAVELRTTELLTPDLAACLRAADVAPCLAVMPGLPTLEEQAELTGASARGLRMIRWMLTGHHDYQGARVAYHPFNALVDEDPGARAAIVRLVASTLAEGGPAFVIINNKAEGSSPLSVQALAKALAALKPSSTSP